MLFNSLEFLGFFAVFVLAYGACKRSRVLRNGWIVLASYVFYGWGDYRLILLLAGVSLMGYLGGLAVEQNRPTGWRRFRLALSSIAILSGLLIFKYLDFAGETMTSLLNQCGWGVRWQPFQFILPIGISFYTFQCLGYVVDVYRGEMRATRNLLDFLAYVAFFPQLVAGPIERSARLLPQLQSALSIDREALSLGLWWVVLGLFKKVVIADSLALQVEMVYGMTAPTGPLVVLATLAFGIQIYCDFSGYTDIARGLAKWLGFDLMQNFNLPYFATNLRDFWHRWHISLSTWLRDYLYIPLGGNRLGPVRTCVNLMLTMLLGGLWHGASMTFVLWGLWHGVGLVILRWWSEHRSGSPALPAPIGWLVTMFHVFYGWLLFRGGSMEHIALLTAALGRFALPDWWSGYALNMLALSAPLMILQLWQRRRPNPDAVPDLPDWGRGLVIGSLLLTVLVFWQQAPAPFLYFQF